MNIEITETGIHYKKKHPVRKKKMPFRTEPTIKKKYPIRGSKDKSYYEPTFGTPECSYEGKKRGRKSAWEKQNPPKLIKKDGDYTLYFD